VLKATKKAVNPQIVKLCPRQDPSEALINGYLQSPNLRKACISGLKYLQMLNLSEKVKDTLAVRS
jgi:hypothetical protein